MRHHKFIFTIENFSVRLLFIIRSFCMNNDFAQFLKDAIKTESSIQKIQFNEDFLFSLLETFIKTSSVLDMVKKFIFYGKPIDYNLLIHSLEDINAHSNSLLNIVDNCGVVEDNVNILIQPETVLDDVNSRIFHGIIGICTESGELAEALQNTLTGNDTDLINVVEEIGDVQWYSAILFDELKVNPYACLNAVIEKLKIRYPDKFTSDNAINRNLQSERETLDLNLKDN